MLVSLRLDENVKDLAFGVDGAPEIDHPAADFQIDLVEMPSRMRLRATLAQVGCDDGSEMIHPPPDGLVRDHNPALGEQVFDVAEAEREPEVQPNRLVNDLRREPVARVADFLHPLGYRASIAPASGRCRDNARGRDGPARAGPNGSSSEGAGRRERDAPARRVPLRGPCRSYGSRPRRAQQPVLREVAARYSSDPSAMSCA